MNAKQWILVGLIAACLIGYRIYTRRARISNSATMPTDPNEMMPALAERAVQYASEKGTTLDYSEGSIQSVEKLLAELSASRANQQLNDREVNVHALRFGAYIGEVIRRTYGGSWKQDHPVGGPNSFPFHWKDGQSFPVGWCGKRIINGEEDNVWVKYQVLRSERYEVQPSESTPPGPAK